VDERQTGGHLVVAGPGRPGVQLRRALAPLQGEGQIDFTTSVENGWLCSRILHAFGLPVASIDRRLHASGGYWLRLPTENCCQATSTPAANKYENNGGPGMVAIAELLAQSSEPSDLTTFFKAQVLFWMLRAIDRSSSWPWLGTVKKAGVSSLWTSRPAACC
jgi:serine/threonine-protein kinase HipA